LTPSNGTNSKAVQSIHIFHNIYEDDSLDCSMPKSYLIDRAVG
jgi:hypothetical protein